MIEVYLCMADEVAEYFECSLFLTIKVYIYFPLVIVCIIKIINFLWYLSRLARKLDGLFPDQVIILTRRQWMNHRLWQLGRVYILEISIELKSIIIFVSLLKL